MSALSPMSGVDAITSHGVGRSRSFVARSIAYDPRTLTTEGIFLGPVLAPSGGPEVLFPLYFIPSQSRIFSVPYFFSRVPGKRREKPKKTKKNGKIGKRREKGSQNIKACRIQNTLKLRPRNDFHHFFYFFHKTKKKLN
jgi:hypothetical protein